MSNKSGIASQVLPLPSGGGALKGIGETFAPDPFTGTGHLSVPIDLPPGRNGFRPQLRLEYSTGNGNGPFGVGWQLGLPGVTRKTAKGVPHYRDRATDQAQRDTFLLSGAEDLVQVAAAGAVERFRPRTEGMFARIERDRSPGSDLWRVRARDGQVSLYGTPAAAGQDAAVLADPADPARVFEWRISATTDPFGNRIEYEYLRDTSPGQSGWAQLYPSRVRYADHDDGGGRRFLVSVSFTYEERPDPFSDCRAGFEIRTRLRCRRIEVRIHAGPDLMVRTYELGYLHDPAGNGASFLGRIQVTGHDGAAREELPPLEFGYTAFEPGRARFQPLTCDGGELPVDSLASRNLELVAMRGNGLPDLVQLDGAARFWSNLGAGRFAAAETMPEVPADVRLADPGVQIGDLNGDGRADLLTQDRGGYFPLAFQGHWSAQGFVRYDHLPSVDLDAPDVRLVDLDGDGVVDALRTGAQPGFELFFNHPTAGWERVETRPPLAERPGLSLADPRVKLADLNGDGLQDLVLVEPGRVDYWPYLGHGRWGRRVTMDPAPAGLPPLGETFEPGRVMFGDVDGDGLDDLVYVEPRRVTVWINQSGNGWSEPIRLDDTPLAADLDGVRLADVLGGGTAGVLWSTVPAGPDASGLHHLDLTGGIKPYLLDRVDNHMGAVTRIRCVPSTTFYLADAERPATSWATPLPFPVQVVERVEVIDQLSGGKLTTTYRYAHGYWDGAEREFRGFARVEQLDSELFEEFHSPGLHGGSARFQPVPARRFSPPVLTRTWFHPGPVGDAIADPSGGRQEADLSGEYWPGDAPALARPRATVQLLASLPAAHRADAIRALRGQAVRTELYALDGSEHEDRPFTVTETQFGILEVSQPAAGDAPRPRVFFAHPDAQRTTSWERGSDPMTQFTFTGDYDRYGQARRHVGLAVPRGRDFRAPAVPGAPYLGTVSSTVFAQRDDDDRYIVDRVAAATTHEIVNDGSQAVFDLRETVMAGTVELAVVGQTVTYYDGEPFEGLPLGELGRFGVPARTERLILTEALADEAYRPQAPGEPGLPPYLSPDGPLDWAPEYPQAFRDLVPPLAGHTFSSGPPGDPVRERGWFVQQSRQRYDVQTDPEGGRGLLTATRDPLGNDVRIDYDQFRLLPARVTDAAGLTHGVVHDYRVMAPRLVTDENGNRAAFAFTPLGLLERSVVMGKQGEQAGDTLAAPGVRFEYQLQPAAAGPGGTVRPVSVRTIRRVRHVNDPPGPDHDQTVETLEYSDGFGRLLQTRSQAGDLIFGDQVSGAGVLPAGQDDPATLDEVRGRLADPARPGVVVSGWQVMDNKGRVVEKFEPFLAAGWEFEPPADADQGRRVELFYDARGRIVRTVQPDGSEQRVVHGVPRDLADPAAFEPTAWEIYVYDANDNAGRSPGPGAVTPFEHHRDTPVSTVADALGRTVSTTGRLRPPAEVPGGPLPPVEELTTRSTYDISGNLLAVTDALGRTAVRAVYDLAGRPLRSHSIDAGTQRVVLDAAGRELERRDGRAALILQAHDVLGRPSRRWARDGAGGPVTLRELLEYGDEGDRDQPAPARAAARAANRLGAVHRHFDEAGLVTVTSYDLKGGILERSRRVIADGPLLAPFPAAGDPSPDWRIAAFRVDWQPPDGGSQAEHADRLLEPVAHQTSTSYDALQRIERVRYPAGTDGRRRELRLAYTPAGRVERITLDGETIIEHIAYDAKGQRTLVVRGNGLMTRYAYDPSTLRLLRLRSERFTRPGPGDGAYRPAGAPLQDLAYAYDLVGNVLEIEERTPGCGVRASPEAGSVADPALRALLAEGDALVRRFDYDPLYRLASATGRECRDPGPAQPWAGRAGCGFGSGGHGLPDQDNAPHLTSVYRQRFTYDQAGNLLRLDHTGQIGARSRQFELADGTNRLRAVGSGQGEVVYTYDTAGNLVGESTSRHLEWDHSGRLTAFRTQAGGSEPSVHAQYLYGAGGERVKKLVRRQGGAVEVSVTVDGIFEQHRHGDAVAPAFVTSTVSVLDGDQRVLEAREGEPHPDDRGPAVRHLLGDHLGSCTLTVDPAGAFVNREEFTPYGESSFGGFARKRYRYMGKERDEESGLSQHGLRFYAPWLARWTSTDPAGAVDGWNLYAFCRLNPLRFVDLQGTDAKERAIRDYSAEMERQAALRTEVNRLENTAAASQQKVNKAYETLDKLDASGLSERALDKEIDRLNKTINQASQEFREAAAALPGARSQLRRSTEELGQLTRRLTKLGVDVQRLEKDLRALKKAPGFALAGAGGGTAAEGGKVLKGVKLLGKVTKIAFAIEAGVATGKTLKHLANGEFRAAAGVVGDFAYDQTIGAAKGLYDLGKSLFSGIGDTIFGPSEPAAPARPSRDRMRDFAQGIMILTAAVGLAIQASQAEAASEQGSSGGGSGSQAAEPLPPHPYMLFPGANGPLPIGPPWWVWQFGR